MAEPIIKLGTNVEIDEDADGELVLRHTPSGATFEYDSQADAWVPSAPMGTQSNPVPGETHLESLITETVVSDYHYAGAYDGEDADARLDAALAAASDGARIYLEHATYSADRTIAKQLTLTGPQRGNSTEVTGPWTIGATNTTVESIRITLPGTLTIASDRATVCDIYEVGDGITVSANDVLLTGLWSADVIFESGTSGGLVDASTNTTVTDNGSNTVGDVT